jgi:hypothetical protein
MYYYNGLNIRRPSFIDLDCKIGRKVHNLNFFGLSWRVLIYRHIVIQHLY